MTANETNKTNKPGFNGEWVKLSELCDKGSSNLRQKDLVGDGPYSVYGASGVVGAKADYQIEKPYVAVIKDGAGIGRAMACEPRTSVLGTLQALIPKDGVNRDYLLYLVESLDLAKTYTGSTIPHIYFKDYGKTLVRYASHQNQAAIAAQINAVDTLAQTCAMQITKLDDLVKSGFVEMFGDITEQYLLGDRLETTSGGTPSRKHPEYYEDGTIPWLTSGEVNKGKIDTPDHYITEAGLCNSSAKLVPANSVVVAMYGATAGQVGLVTYETTTNQAVCCIKPNAQVAPVFLRYALEFKKDWMIGQCAGGAQPNISQGIVKKVAIPDVTLARQQEFANFVSAIDKLGFDVRQQIGNCARLNIDRAHYFDSFAVWRASLLH